MQNKETDPNLLRAKSEGWDSAIDLMANTLRKKMEILHAEARKTSFIPAKDQLKYGVELFKALVEELKKAKGDPAKQVFDADEVREIVDHVTGSTQTMNNSTMEWFDHHFFPSYIAGETETRKFTTKQLKQ